MGAWRQKKGNHCPIRSPRESRQTRAQGPRSHARGPGGHSTPPLFRVRGPNAVLDPPLFVSYSDVDILKTCGCPDPCGPAGRPPLVVTFRGLCLSVEPWMSYVSMHQQSLTAIKMYLDHVKLLENKASVELRNVQILIINTEEAT